MNTRRLAPLFGMMLLLGVVLLAPAAHAGWTIAGTVIGVDLMTGTPDIRVTVFPDDIAALTDNYGNFLLSWSGKQGYLTFETKTSDGKPWCKRYTLRPRAATQADSLLDLGQIRVITTMPVNMAQKPTRLPNVLPPAELALPGPAAGQPDSLWMLVKYEVDMYGHLTSAAQTGGPTAPPAMLDAITQWLRSVDWQVSAETRCNEESKFMGTEPFPYAWRDGVWKYTAPGGRRMLRDPITRQPVGKP